MKPWLEIKGILTGTPDGTGQPHGKYIYQKTVPGMGNVPGDPTASLQVRRWVRPTPTNTSAQQPYRARFALGVAEWHTLSDTAKEAWRGPGSKLGLNRFQAFMRDWCRTQPLPGLTEWDSGATTWTGPGTIFDTPETFWNDEASGFDNIPTAWE